MGRLVLGYDVGSSSIKASLIDVEKAECVAQCAYPDEELPISSLRPGWAEQDPERWWQCVVAATRKLSASQNLSEVSAVGISYQMHGLVLLDEAGRVVRPSIIWCDSRAVATGERAFAALGKERILSSLLNSPGNFTASKLRWVMEHEPEAYSRVTTAFLPGDYIAFKLSGERTTTSTGLSEGILWDFKQDQISSELLHHYEIPSEIFPRLAPIFGEQGRLTSLAAEDLGLRPGTPISYRAGDQPNNAWSLKALDPGEVAATAGTSGVIYAVTDKKRFDPSCRVNTFLHVTHRADNPRLGILLCLNGTGISYSWLRKHLGLAGSPYGEIDKLAAISPDDALGLKFYPFGNGAERVLANRVVGSSLEGINYNIHSREHILRSALNGIAFSFRYGMDVMRELGTEFNIIRAGDANMFGSPLFRQIASNVLNVPVERFNTDGAQGAARGAAFGAGLCDRETAFMSLNSLGREEPAAVLVRQYQELYEIWREGLETKLNGCKP